MSVRDHSTGPTTNSRQTPKTSPHYDDPPVERLFSDPKLLCDILSFVVLDLGYLERRQSLCALSLVSSAWRKSAQKLLFGELAFFDEQSIAAWSSSEAVDRFKVESVHLDGRFGNVSNVSTDLVLRRVHGIQRLRIDFISNLSTNVFLHPNLATVTSLVLHTKLWCDAVPVVLPFSIKTLVLGGSYHPLAFLHALFENSADTLQFLTTTMQAQQSPSERALLTSSLSRLNVLHTYVDFQRPAEEFISVLSALPSSVQHLSTSFVDRNRLWLIISALARPNLAKLKTLRFMYMPQQEFTSTEAGRELLALCRARNIAIIQGHNLEHLRQEHYLSSDDKLKPFV